MAINGNLGLSPWRVNRIVGKVEIDRWRCARAVHLWLWVVAYAVIVVPTHMYEVYSTTKSVQHLARNKTLIYLLIELIICSFFVIFSGTITLSPVSFCQILNGLYKYTESFPVFGIGWTIFLLGAGIHYQVSRKAVASWKWQHWSSRDERMYMERVKKTCFPISFGDGKRFVINPTKVLQFIRSVSKNTFRAVAMYGKAFGH
ncbi:unnamed protein product [Orchesella dallaii]|uniref:Uncharacterized protein n=1 Tax=Orchesella dallaii TaxID=48710 RepID=A0ABP1RJ85_9HEXA